MFLAILVVIIICGVSQTIQLVEIKRRISEQTILTEYILEDIRGKHKYYTRVDK